MGLRDFYDERVLPRIIEMTCSERMTGRWRAQVCADVHGEVLEVGFGSGANLAHYPAAVERIAAVEPSDLAWQRAQPSVREFGRPVRRVGLDGADLVLDDASVDAVVSSYTMCTIAELDAALAEFQRVLRPGGALHFVEHSLSPDAAVAARQRRIQPMWGRLAGGCHLIRDIPELVVGSGFEMETLETFYTPGPGFTRPFGWMTVGRASVRG